MAITKISSGVISANAVTATIVAENVITSSEIATNGVGTLQIADDAVTSAKLDTNIDVAGTLDVTGVLTADSNVVIAGNLTVNGSTVTNSATNTTIEDALIELGTGTTGTPANDAGIIIERGSAANAFMGYDESADKFIVATTTATGASTGNLSLTAAPLVTGALTASGLSYPTSDGSSAQVLQTDGSGNLSFATVVTGGAVVHNYTATGDGSTATFDTGINPQDEVNTWVHIDGVYQNKSEYSYNGTSITFSTAPDSGAAIDIISGTQSGFSTADSVLGVYSATTTDTATYDTGLSASTENNVNIFIEGVYQPKSTYTWSGSTITFDANTPAGLALEVIASKTLTAGAVVTGSITDSAVTTAKIANNAITSAKIVNNSITGADISATTDIVANTFTGALTGNVTGNVTGNLTGTIQTAAQTNITSVGTLTGLTTSGNVNITGNIDASGLLKVGVNDTEYANNYLRFKSAGAGYIDHNTVGQDINFRISNSSALDTTIMTLDAGVGSVGINQTSPSSTYKLDVGGAIRSNTAAPGFHLRETDASNQHWTLGSYGGPFAIRDVTGGTYPLYVETATPSSTLYLDSSGNIGVGTSTIANESDHKKLKISGASGTGAGMIEFADGSNNIDGAIFSDNGHLFIVADRDNATADSSIRFRVDGSSEKMRINASGGLEIGDGTNYGYLKVINDSAVVQYLDRRGTDGIVLEIRHADSKDGQINTLSGRMAIGSDDTGIFFDSTRDCISPFTMTGNDGRGDLIDIGRSGVKFKDLYLSGGIQFDSRTNKLDDYEEGTWSPTLANAYNITSLTLSEAGRYTKIGNLVHLEFQVSGSFTNAAVESRFSFTLPFNSATTSSRATGMFSHHLTTFSNGRFNNGQIFSGTTSDTTQWVYISTNQLSGTGSFTGRGTVTYVSS